MRLFRCKKIAFRPSSQCHFQGTPLGEKGGGGVLQEYCHIMKTAWSLVMPSNWVFKPED